VGALSEGGDNVVPDYAGLVVGGHAGSFLVDQSLVLLAVAPVEVESFVVIVGHGAIEVSLSDSLGVGEVSRGSLKMGLVIVILLLGIRAERGVEVLGSDGTGEKGDERSVFHFKVWKEYLGFKRAYGIMLPNVATFLIQGIIY